MRKILGRAVLLGVAVGAALAFRNYVLRNYLKGPAASKEGDVQIALDTGAIVEPDPVEAREFADIARKILEIAG